MDKPRVIRDYKKLETKTKQLIKLKYPSGFEDALVQFRNREGDLITVLPFETETVNYLVKMTTIQAQRFIEEDDDYGDDGTLRDEVKEDYEALFEEESWD
ncbi:MAG: hypothetical protein ACQERC_02430 [Bacteroidota bacterium]